jgi:hypothetical protein
MRIIPRSIKELEKIDMGLNEVLDVTEKVLATMKPLSIEYVRSVDKKL